MDLEQSFLDSILEQPGDPSLWLILADWLEDQNDPRAELVRLTLSLRTEPDHPDFDERQRRVQALIVGGMLPLVPGFTNSIGMDLALIPAGTFLMGSSAEEPHHENDEGPQHWVHLTRPYYLSRTTITQRQYRHVLRRNPSTYHSRNKGGGQHPVERVTFGDAQRFCHTLSSLAEERKQGRRYRLPTEAEWEYACRAGTTTPYSCGDTLTPSLANYDTNDHTLDLSEMRAEEQPLLRTCPVAQYPPNPWGLYDMHGNVWEWCADWFDNYLSDEQTDPTGPETNSEWDLRVIRGGGWNSYGRWCRSARRSNTNDDTEDADLGFRVVCVIES